MIKHHKLRLDNRPLAIGPTELHMKACDCLRRGDCYTPGSHFGLYVVVNGRRIEVRPCQVCGE